jgi:glycosyltransferase involved in cell wall biosynthesis
MKPVGLHLWYLSNHFLKYGGAQLRFRKYIPEFADRGVNVSILAGTPTFKDISESDWDPIWDKFEIGSSMPPQTLDGATLHTVRLPKQSGPLYSDLFKKAILESVVHTEGSATVAQFLNSRPDMISTIKTLRKRRVGVVGNISQYPNWHTKLRKRWLRKREFLKLYDSFDAIVCNSPELHTLLTRTIGVQTKVVDIPNGVDLARFSPASTPIYQAQRRELRSKLGINEEDVVIICVGGIQPRKGPDLAIRAWNNLQHQKSKVHLLLIGPSAGTNSNPDFQNYTATITSLVNSSTAPERVHFMGHVDNVEDYLRASDIFLLPTSREGTPNAALEAMASGLPVILTQHLGMSSSLGVANREFRLVDRNVESITLALREMIEEPAVLGDFARAGLKYIQANMDINHSIDRYISLYREAGLNVAAKK